MERKLASGLMLTLLAISMLTLAFNIQQVRASGTIYIRADGSVDPSTANITSVDNVTYTLTGNINDSIVIEKNNIVVDGTGYTLHGSGSGCGFNLTMVNNITIRNMEIKTFWNGISLYYSSNNIISGNNITANIDGIYLYSSSNNNSISGNNITNNNRHGIALSGYSDYNSISGNNIIDNGEYGVYLFWSSYNTISGNNITNNEYGIHLHESFNNIISGNNITENYSNGINLVWSSNNNSISGNNITNNWEDGISLDGSFNNRISGNNITNNNSYGVWLEDSSSYNSISGNNITANNSDGIHLYESSNNRISGNNITNNDDGIYLDSSANNTVSGNNITNNTFSGVLLLWSFNNKVSGNNVTDNLRQGITLDQSHNNSVSDNTITNNSYVGNYSGIYLYSSFYNTISGNIIMANHYGIDLSWSSNNIIYLNDFIDNTQHAYIGTSGYANFWDDGYPSGGNYWSDYTGVDADGDGIGDTPYVIDADNQDRYPLMNPWTPSEPVTPTPPEAQVGVKAGDWIKYDYTVTGWPSGTPRPEWLKVEILSVEGTTATVRVTLHMSDGTEQSDTVNVDVATGSGTFQGLSGFVIPANCTTGDSIYMSGYGNVTLDGETTKTRAGASRAVVYASFSQYGTELTYYWDKETGVMVEATTISGGITGTARATETNMWQAVPSPLWMQWWFYAIVAIVIGALVGVVHFLKKRKQPTAPPLSTEQGEPLK